MQENKLRVVHILDNLDKGGKERNVLDICRSIDSNNFDCIVFCLFSSERNEFFIDIPNIEIVRLNLIKNKSVVVQLFFNLFQIKKIYRSLKIHTPDIVHTHTFFYSVLPVFIIIHFLKKVKHFHTIHTGGMHYLNKTISNKIKLYVERLFYVFNNTTIIAISSTLQLRVQNLFPNCRVSYVQNGINSMHKDVMEMRNNVLPNGVYLARLVDGKNHITILKALSELKKCGIDFKFTFLGGGPLHDNLLRFSYSLGINENVFFMGDVEDVNLLLGSFNFGIFASEYEGFSLALIEMMSAGIPVFVSNAQTILDMGISEENSILFETHDYLELKRLIVELFGDPINIKKYSDKSLDFAKNFSVEKMIGQLQSSYLS